MTFAIPASPKLSNIPRNAKTARSDRRDPSILRFPGQEDGAWLARLSQWLVRDGIPSDETVKSELAQWVPEYSAVGADLTVRTDR
jgi:hypothetical protein